MSWNASSGRPKPYDHDAVHNAKNSGAPMRVSITTIYDVPDDLQHGELQVLQQKLAEQKGPSEIQLKAGQTDSRLITARVYSVDRPEPLHS